MYDSILVPVDGSDQSRQATAYAAGVASACGADLELVHVLDTVGLLRPLFGDEERKKRRERARKLLSDAAELAEDADVVVETTVAEGDAAESLLRTAEEREVDLVVVGKGGRGGLGKRLLGSVSTAVLRHADVPVVVVPPGAVDPDPAVEDLLVPTDGSECAGRAVDHGGSVAGQFGSALHLLNVVDVSAAAGPFDAGGVGREYVERLEAEAEKRVEAGRQRVADADLSVSTAVTRGTPHEGINSYVDDGGIDLVVMGSRGRSEVQRRLLGSVTERVVREASVPVLVVR
jgi:nucleotide-binding universal stress UspA family protein